MTDTIAVVRMALALEDAYAMGYDRFEGMDAEAAEGFTFAPFTDSATWANTVLPSLRARAGFEDSGHGTYRVDRQVAVIAEGDEDDEPADAELVFTQWVFGRLVDEYRRGAHDAADAAVEQTAE